MSGSGSGSGRVHLQGATCEVNGCRALFMCNGCSKCDFHCACKCQTSICKRAVKCRACSTCMKHCRDKHATSSKSSTETVRETGTKTGSLSLASGSGTRRKTVEGRSGGEGSTADQEDVERYGAAGVHDQGDEERGDWGIHLNKGTRGRYTRTLAGLPRGMEIYTRAVDRDSVPGRSGSAGHRAGFKGSSMEGAAGIGIEACARREPYEEDINPTRAAKSEEEETGLLGMECPGDRGESVDSRADSDDVSWFEESMLDTVMERIMDRRNGELDMLKLVSVLWEGKSRLPVSVFESDTHLYKNGSVTVDTAALESCGCRSEICKVSEYRGHVIRRCPATRLWHKGEVPERTDAGVVKYGGGLIGRIRDRTEEIGCHWFIPSECQSYYIERVVRGYGAHQKAWPGRKPRLHAVAFMSRVRDKVVVWALGRQETIPPSRRQTCFIGDGVVRRKDGVSGPALVTEAAGVWFRSNWLGTWESSTDGRAVRIGGDSSTLHAEWGNDRGIDVGTTPAQVELSELATIRGEAGGYDEYVWLRPGLYRSKFADLSL